MKIHNIDATGSFTYNGVDLSNLTGSTSDSGSFSTQILNLNQVSSSLNSFTSSINTTIKSKLDSESVISGSIQVSITGTAGYSTFSSSVSSSIGSLSSSVATTTSDLSSSIGSLSSSVATNTSGLAGRITTIEGRGATTGSNAFIGTQTITGSLYISSDLIVQGSSSLQNITASAVNIGANIVNLNTANPAIRFAGLSIFDSGSIGGSGSFLYDAVQDEFIFIHRGDNTNITSSVAMMGPQTYNNVGNEIYPTVNHILKGTGNEHVGDSCIFDNGTTTCVKNNFISTGTGLFSGQLCSITGVFGSKGGGAYGVLISDNDQSNVRLRFTNTGTGGQSISIVGGNPGLSNSGLAFYDETNTCTRMYIGSNGNIGINSGNPLSKVYISHGGNNPIGCAGDFCIDAVVLEGGGGRSAIRSIQHDAGNQPAAGDLQFLNFLYNGSTYNWYERMRIRANGNVGINTCTPSNLLDIQASNNTTNQFRVNSCDGLNAGLRSYTTSDGAGLIINHYYAVGGAPYLRTSDFVSNQGDAAATQMRFFTKDASVNPALAMIITSGRCVGINTNNPQSVLDVQNCINSSYDPTNTLISNQWLRTSNPSTSACATSGILFVAQGPGGGNGISTINGVTTSCGSMSITFGTRHSSGAITERMRIASNGSLGVGTDSPVPHSGVGLVVKGTDGGRGIIEVWDGTCGKAVFQQVGGTTYIGNLYKGTSGGSLRLLVNGGGTSATEAVVITCGANVGIGTETPKTYSSLTTQGQIISLSNIGIDSGQSFRLNNYYNSGTVTDRTISNGYAASIGLSQQTGAMLFSISTMCTAADNNITQPSRMAISNCGHILVNQAANSQADYSVVTISGTCNKTQMGGVGGSLLHLSSCENDTPFGAKFTINGNANSCLRYFSIQTGDHYITNQGNIVFQEAGGHVGVGTTSPRTKLQVTGNYNAEVPVLGCAHGVATFTSTNTNYGLQLNSTSDGSFHIQSQRFDNIATAYPLILNFAGGNVLVGTQSSLGKLTVGGTVAIPALVGGDIYTIDTMNGYQSIANGGFVDFNGMSGMLLVNNWLNGGVTLYLMGGGNTAPLGSVVNQVGTMHHSPGVGGYRWCNNYGSTATFGFQVFRTRNTA